jgi:lipoprotein-anchoring transpeptidase ErfK/SrfK
VLSKSRAALAIYATAAVLALLAGSALAYDTNRNDMIADGVTVAGVDVGGLSRGGAEKRLRERLSGRLERPVSVRVAGRRFRLTADRAEMIADVEGMAGDAVDESRRGGLPGRVWRGLTSGSVHEDVPAKVYYSRLAVRGFVNRVARSVDREARDAKVEFATASLPAVPSQTGLKLRSRPLRGSIQAAIARPTGRLVRGRVRVVHPKITTEDLSGKYKYVVTVDRPNFRLRFFKDLKLAKTYKIAVGQAGLETPAGLYHVQDKAVNPSWHVPKSAWAGKLAGKVIPPGPDNPIKARWMGIYAGAGIHGTSDVGSLGTAASHGCIRMAIPDVEELYDKVPIQTPVFIQ